MTQIRSDLVGVVYPHTADGIPMGMALSAGDDVPEGAVIGAHLLDGEHQVSADEQTPAPPATPEPPRGNASRDEWAAYAATLGVEVPEGAKQGEIKTLIAAQN